MKELPEEHLTLLKRIGEIAASLGQEAYVVGGYVRDYFLNRLDHNEPDIDIVTLGSGLALAREVARQLSGTKLSIFKQFGTAHVRYRKIDLEFVGARKESYRSDSRKPIVEDGTLEEDQLRRDLTINALSWSLNPKTFGLLLDPFHGIQDLQNRIIRTPIDPESTFSDDPLRMMRAIRFSTQLGFEIDSGTWNGIQTMAHRLSIISQERVAEELNKIILSPIPSIGFGHLLASGLLEQFLPEMVRLQGVEEVNGVRHKDNFWHTLEVLDNVARSSDDLWLRWAAILHDIAKPPTKRFSNEAGWTFHGHDAVGAKWVPKIFRRLSLPLDERMKRVQKLVRLHLRPIALVSEEVTDSAIRRLIYEAGDEIEDLMTLCRADITSKNERKVRIYLRNFDRVEKRIREVEKKDRIRNWKNPVSGEDIMNELGVSEGPVIGRIKNAVKEAIFDGIIHNERDAAIDYMKKVGKKFLS
ncbi:MAG: CCA tRNA nucleotidyltransferase [Bacteroidota bacterium]